MVCASMTTSCYSQQKSLKEQLVGTWTLVEANNYGPAPNGSAIFESNGRFSIILLRSDLPKYASNNRTKGTPNEYKATVEGSFAFFGTYSISGTDLNLHVEGSTFPNWTGTEQKRVNLTVTDDQFKYMNPVPSGGVGSDVVSWKRVK